MAGGMQGPTMGSGIMGAMTRGAGTFPTALRTGAQALGGLGSTLGGGYGTGSMSSFGSALTSPLNMARITADVYGGMEQEAALKRMAEAQQQGIQQAQQAYSPFLQSGQAAQSQLGSMLGLGGESEEEVMQRLQATPGYKFQLGQGQQALERSQAARGGLMSGRAIQEAQRLGQGLASQTYNDYLRQLQQQAATGLSAAGGYGRAAQLGGLTQAMGIGGQQAARSGTLQSLLSGVGVY